MSHCQVVLQAKYPYLLAPGKDVQLAKNDFSLVFSSVQQKHCGFRFDFTKLLL